MSLPDLEQVLDEFSEIGTVLQRLDARLGLMRYRGVSDMLK